MTDVKKLLELINSDDSEVSYKAAQETKVHEFLNHFGFKPGETPYNKYILETLWQDWIKSDNRLLLRKFREELLKILPHKWHYTVFLDESAFTMDKAALAKKVGKLMFKGRYGTQKKAAKEEI